jgi:uncharacterized protein
MMPSSIPHRSAAYPLPTILLIWLVLTAAYASALEVPPLKSRVNDYAVMLSPATVSQLENSLALFEQQQSTQLAVLTVASLAGDSIEDFSLRVAETWKIGQQGLDNGALLLIARDDRKLRIEVGYGLEGRLTDLVAGRIIRDVISPQFRNGRFDQGVIDGVNAMMAAVTGEFSAEQAATRPSDTGATGPGDLFIPLLFGLFVISRLFGRHKWATATVGGVAAPVLAYLVLGARWLLLAAMVPIGFVAGFIVAGIAGSLSSGRSGGPWIGSGGGFSGGSFGGGFSGGGGGFGGGGASGGW